MDDHRVSPEDEGRHPAGPDDLWGESWYADFVDGRGGPAGYVRWGLYPNLGVSWWTALVVQPGSPMVASVSYRLAVPDTGLAVTDGPWSVALERTEDLRRFTVHADTPAARCTRPTDPYRGDPGEPAHMGLDLEWATEGSPYHYLLTTRYEVPCTVRGTLSVDGERWDIEGQGQRDHSWGVRDWWIVSWCWMSCRLDDGTRVHCADIRVPGSPVAFGYVQHPGTGQVEPVSALAVTEDLDPDGLARRARITLEPGALTLDIEPVAFGPLLLTAPDGRTSRFPRAHIRVTAGDGRTGEGWIEWNQPQPQPAPLSG